MWRFLAKQIIFSFLLFKRAMIRKFGNNSTFYKDYSILLRVQETIMQYHNIPYNKGTIPCHAIAMPPHLQSVPLWSAMVIFVFQLYFVQFPSLDMQETNSVRSSRPTLFIIGSQLGGGFNGDFAGLAREPFVKQESILK